MSCARKQFRIMQCKKLLHFLLPLLENESEITIRKTSQFKALFALTIFLALTTSISIGIITSNDDDDHDVDNILVRRHAKNKRKCLNF